MHLLAPLASGVAGAENGSVEIYKRGTSSRATLYSDFEGTSQLNTPVSLDSYGAAELYSDEVVDVVCKDSDGVTVREFTVGSSSPAVEVRSSSFTGTSYDDGSGLVTSGANKPASLQTLMDLWLTVNGAIDWKVDINGSTETIQEAIEKFAGIFYNVKAYGATGDGVTDDSAAIIAADLAAAAGGGIVVFPAGTYLCASQIDFSAGVSLLGAGAHVVELVSSHTAAYSFRVQGDPIVTNWVQGISFKRNATSAQPIVQVAIGHSTFLACVFGDGTVNDGELVEVTSADASFQSCLFRPDASHTALVCASSAEGVEVTACRFLCKSTAGSTLVDWDADKGTISGCTFDFSAITATSTIGISTGASIGHLVAVGNIFTDSNGASVPVTAFSFSNTSGVIVESGNLFPISANFTNYAFASGSPLDVQLGSRDIHGAELVNNGTTVAIESDQYGFVHLENNSGSTVTINLDANVPRLSRFRLAIENTHGGGTALTIAAGTAMNVDQGGSTVLGTVPDGDVLILEFQAMENSGGTMEWFLVGTPQSIDT